MKEDKCKTEHPGELCCLDEDPIYAAQDYDDKGIRKFRLRQLRVNGSVSYEVSFDGRSLPWHTRLVYSVKRTSKGWRVDDIEYKDGSSLRKMLSCPLEWPAP